MKSRWSDEEAAACADDVELCAHVSRLLGAETSLVVSGGGNSSVKATEHDVFGEPVEVLHVKGSGWDMASIQRGGFAPLRLDRVARLTELDRLSDARMAAELRAASLDPAAPAPSVESILHATLPYRFVLHSHADAVLALTDTPDGEAHARAVYGEDVVIVPYVMPGFALAKLCAERFPAERHDGTVGMVLLNHGLFTFADDARSAYEAHLDLVTRALTHVDLAAWDLTAPTDGGVPVPESPEALAAVATLRRDVSAAAGRPMIVRCSASDAARRFAARSDLGTVALAGPATPDHVLRTKPVPLLGRDVATYAEAYRGYVERHRHRLGDREPVAIDPAPRVIMDPELGVLTAGRRVADAVATAEIVDHTVWVAERAVALGGYRSVDEADVFDVEYWELEQAKLARQPAPAPMTGRVALITGAASGIGRACARALRDEGAAVVGLDLDAAVETVADGPDYLGVQGDARDPDALAGALAEAVRSYGGLDVLVLNAGVFPPAVPLAELDPAAWSEQMDLHAGAAVHALRAAHPYLRRAPGGGSVVVVASKNVPAPGPGVAPYSASKAALTQLARVAALEWGREGIRVNVVHPDAVFDTGLWTEETIAARAATYGLTPEQYRTRNVLGAEVAAADVARVVVALAGPTFARTTGAQIPVDGGNERVI